MTKYFKHISKLIAASLVLANTTAVSAATDLSGQDNSSKDTLHVLSRVIESNNNGLLRYSYIDENGEKYDLDTSSETVDYKSRKAANLPSRYDLREHGLETSVKDQGVTGSCWAFAAIKASESNAILNNITTDADSTDFSENHLAWYSYNGVSNKSDSMYGDNITNISSTGSIRPPFFPSMGKITSTFAYDAGGNVLTAITTLAQWSGIESEDNAPFKAGSLDEERSMANSMSDAGESMRYNSLAHLQNSECYDNSSRAQIKQALMKHGALDISMYYDTSGFEKNTPHGISFYQTRYSGKMAQAMANHCVTIIGWDDNYSKNNFALKPSGNGAWLIANSYSEKYNDDGYFWLSYYEPSICDIFTFDIEPVSNYDHNYQYDGIGYGDTVYVPNKKITAANVFTTDKGSAQSLKAVSFYTLTDGQKYNIKIYKNVSGSSPENGTLVKECTTNGTAKLSGYHTIPLSSECTLNPGEKFSVVITYKYNSSTGNQAYMPIEGQTVVSNGIKYSYSSKKGQSYYYLNGKWHDAYSDGYNNICLKAFTTDLNKSSASVPTQTPVATTAPAITKAPAATTAPAITEAPAATQTPAVTETPAAIVTPAPSGSGTFVQTKVRISRDTVVLGKNENYKLSISLDNALSNMSKDDIIYTSNNNNVAVVDSSGVVTAKSVGIAFITASIDRGEPAYIKIVVKKAPSRVSLSVSARKKLKKGQTFKISANIPSGCASYHFTYSSSNKNIAKVNKNGKVTAVKKGRAVITVKTYNNKKTSLVVIVR